VSLLVEHIEHQIEAPSDGSLNQAHHLIRRIKNSISCSSSSFALTI
jgi:hypothetical protein